MRSKGRDDRVMPAEVSADDIQPFSLSLQEVFILLHFNFRGAVHVGAGYRVADLRVRGGCTAIECGDARQHHCSQQEQWQPILFILCVI
jgi:hypothetical protein